MSSEITIRPAEKHDTGALGQLINAIQREEFAIPITLAEQPDLADIEGAYRNGAGAFWVAEAAGRIVGTIALIDIGDGGGALRKMFVDKDFRGAEKGVANGLLETLLAHAPRKASPGSSSAPPRPSWPPTASTRKAASSLLTKPTCRKPFRAWPWTRGFTSSSFSASRFVGFS
jgi:N-acetylglutamate synthase-like GNAT family acetyltransferase